jgi:hypothetical protein
MTRPLLILTLCLASLAALSVGCDKQIHEARLGQQSSSNA